MKRMFYLRTVAQFFLMMILWLLLSGHYDVKHITMGVFSCLLVVALNWRLRLHYYVIEELPKCGTDPDHPGPRPIRILHLLFYIPWLMGQIVLASLQVAAVVLNPKMPIDPGLFEFRAKLPNTMARVILGNSITLTPGTITLRIKGDEFLVHGLMDASFSGIGDGSLPAEVAKLYDPNPGNPVSDLRVIRSRGAM